MRKLMLCSAVLLAWGCKDGGGTPPPVATQVAVLPGSVSLDAIGATRVVQARVADQNGRAMTGVAITWASSSAAVIVAGAGGDSAVVTAVGNGAANITATAGGIAGSASVQVAQVATVAQKVGGDGQTGAAGTALPAPLTLGVRDRLGGPVAGVPVTFVKLSGDGALSSASSATGADGNATVTWTLGTEANTYQAVSATAAGLATVQFQATIVAGPAAAAAPTAGNNQTTGVRAAVPVHPAVMVRDAFGNRVSGATVQFTVTGGGGSVTGATRTTVDGAATVGGWTLGAAPGVNTLTATIPGTAVAPVVFTAMGGVAGTLSIAAGDNQAAMAETPVATAPAVVVRDGSGNPVAGISVTFAVTAGGGAVGSASATTDAGGVASAGSWTLGAGGGPNTLTATAVGILAPPVVLRGTGCVGGGGIGYRLTLCMTTAMTASQRTVFQTAAQRWSAVVSGDLPDVPTGSIPAGSCGAGSPGLNLTVDDLLIFAGVQTIDGPGGVLGSAGPCFVRDGSNLPVIGVMRFDAADMAQLETAGLLNAVIIHEMGHVLGIGSLWPTLSLLQNASTASITRDTYFSGANGIAGFNAVGGSFYTGGQKVPVENTGGQGTMNAHWRESVMGRELMTGFINTGSNPLSEVTVRSLVDMGYVVNLSFADPFMLPLQPAAGAAAGLRLHNDVYTGPRYTIDRQGRFTRIRN
jgi:Leishmanolysin